MSSPHNSTSSDYNKLPTVTILGSDDFEVEEDPHCDKEPNAGDSPDSEWQAFRRNSWAKYGRVPTDQEADEFWGFTASRAAPANEAAPPPSPKRKRALRPAINLTTELHANTDEAIEALQADDDLYQRNGALVHVLRADLEAVESSPVAISVGSPTIRHMRPATLRERLSSCAVFRRFNGREKKWTKTLPPEPIVSAVHARGSWPSIRPLIAIIETPTMRKDGSLVMTPGYDRETGYLYAPTIDFPQVPDAPTREDAARALADLRDVFVDFPFVSHAERDVPIAAVLTLLARPAVEAVPAFVLDASTRGSGKSLLADAIAEIATGRGAAKMSLPHDDVEQEKVLGAYALQGAQLICLDNAKAGVAVGGAPLDRVLTARDRVELRVLGKSDVPSLPWRAVVLITGNNVTFCGDTSRRVLIARLEPGVEDPERRTGFRHPDLLEYIRAERSRLVVAALTILRAFVIAGKPNAPRLGSFEPWSELIAGAIAYAGGCDVLLTKPRSDADVNDEAAAFRTLLQELPRLDVGGKGVTTRDIIATLWPSGSPAKNDGHDTLREAIAVMCDADFGYAPDVGKLGKKLRNRKGQVMAGYQLVEAGTDSKKNVVLWRSIPVTAK